MPPEESGEQSRPGPSAPERGSVAVDYGSVLKGRKLDEIVAVAVGDRAPLKVMRGVERAANRRGYTITWIDKPNFGATELRFWITAVPARWAQIYQGGAVERRRRRH